MEVREQLVEIGSYIHIYVPRISKTGCWCLYMPIHLRTPGEMFLTLVDGTLPLSIAMSSSEIRHNGSEVPMDMSLWV